ncbi:MAG TPA: signal recognition particle-docking protein FtsY [Kofleriaceae bacterium]|nr:signal recognition particle-docking protein FtsY [Kofleriaceae bacterium]
MIIGTELVYFLVAVLVLGGVLFAIRRASARQLRGTEASQRRLEASEDKDEDEDGQEAAQKAPSRQRRARPTATKTKAKSKPKAAPEPEIEPKKQAKKQAKKRARTDDEPEIQPEPEDIATPDEQDAAALRDGLAKTRGGFVSRLGRLLSKKRIDGDVLDELEEVLFGADIGPKTAEKLFGAVKGALTRDQLSDPDAVWSTLRAETARILEECSASQVDFAREKPFVLLTIGVNGVGKTTTIGKLAAKLTGAGNRVLLAAGDTFRAAAVEQLQIWGERSGAEVVCGKSGSDPSSVIFDAIRRGSEAGVDVVIADTAGRLHTKAELMDELKKVGRVADKALAGAPHETWLVLDATTGQNAIQQAILFKEAMSITGIVLTKLDGTAKGGVILGICDELKVPVRFIGIGEKVEDLRPFDAAAFVDALYEQAPAKDAA